ncbi:unnamed protein product [Phytophthora fragariaefolia]|uniref:Unnamed protein product n=1 Tax=Phytophthora fragariaefolia TaxID=1490495 RepID=A0A9W7CXX8_9STRA|nr:unnamed protein product [Phytophthora fragariaefolia]
MGAIIPAVYIQIWGAAYLTLHWFIGLLCVVMFISVAVAVVFGKEIPLEKTDDVSTCRSIQDSFVTIFKGIRTMPSMLIVYAAIMFFVLYGYSAYNGNKGQFFGFVVYGGTADNADSCNPCSAEQIAYNHGVSKASGIGDLLFNIVGYVYSWMLPLLVRQFGARVVLSGSMLAQALLMVMAFCSNVGFDLFVVAILSVAQGSAFALMVPTIIHVFGGRIDTDIGMYVGALNSANCFGQLLNFAIGTAVVQTSLGYKLPVFLGGAMSFLGFLVCAFLFKVKMHSINSATVDLVLGSPRLTGTSNIHSTVKTRIVSPSAVALLPHNSHYLLSSYSTMMDIHRLLNDDDGSTEWEFDESDVDEEESDVNDTAHAEEGGGHEVVIVTLR